MPFSASCCRDRNPEGISMDRNICFWKRLAKRWAIDEAISDLDDLNKDVEADGVPGALGGIAQAQSLHRFPHSTAFSAPVSSSAIPIHSIYVSTSWVIWSTRDGKDGSEVSSRFNWTFILLSEGIGDFFFCFEIWSHYEIVNRTTHWSCHFFGREGFVTVQSPFYSSAHYYLGLLCKVFIFNECETRHFPIVYIVSNHYFRWKEVLRPSRRGQNKE